MPRWATIAMAVATVTTIVLAFVGGHAYARYFGARGFWLNDGIALGLTAVALAAWLPRWRLERATRVALVLPVAQLAAVGVGWTLWCAMRSRAVVAHELGTLMRHVPLSLAVAIAGTATVLVARAIAWRRRSEWLHAAVMLALVHLLLAGLWLPFAAQVHCADLHRYWMMYDERALLASRSLLALALVPPFIAAVAFTAAAIRHPDFVARWRQSLASGLAFVAIGAIATRLRPNTDSALVYTNFLVVLLALVIVAAGMLAMLGGSLWLRSRRARRVLADPPLDGIVAIEHHQGADVGRVQIAGWLRGPRVLSLPFTVVTQQGVIAVAGDGCLAADLPERSTRLATHDSVTVLHEGDRVALAGYVTPSADHPFRTSTVPVPGPRGVLVVPASDAPAGFAAAALALWRPCLAYLAVVATIALPGIAAALVVP